MIFSLNTKEWDTNKGEVTMFEKEIRKYLKDSTDYYDPREPLTERKVLQMCMDCAELGYNKANEQHSPDEHIDKDRTVLGIIKHCNKTRYSLVQWNGEWWYQYGTYNAEVRLIAWYNIPELKESE